MVWRLLSSTYTPFELRPLSPGITSVASAPIAQPVKKRGRPPGTGKANAAAPQVTLEDKLVKQFNRTRSLICHIITYFVYIF